MTGRAASRLAAAALAVAVVLGTAACSDDAGSGKGGDGDRAADGASTTSSVVFTGDQGSSFCRVLEELGADTVLYQPSESAEDIEAAYTHLLDVLHQAAEAAPRELESDVGLLVEGISALDEALRTVGYDYEALAASPDGPAVSAAVNDPSFTVAGDRIQAYKRQVCKL